MSQIENVQNIFSKLNANNLDLLDSLYDEGAQFQDPLGTHHGRHSIKSYFAKLYKNVNSIEFSYSNHVSDDETHVLIWTMNLKAKGLNFGKPIQLDGNSVLIFNEKGLVSYHRDYYDMGEFIYEHIPILGWIVRKIKKQLEN